MKHDIEALVKRLRTEIEHEEQHLKDIGGPTGTRNSVASNIGLFKNTVRTEIVTALEEILSRSSTGDEARDEAYRKAARDEYHREGEIEIDEGAVVSKGEDPGAYVQAWVWVGNSEAGLADEDEEKEKETGQ